MPVPTFPPEVVDGDAITAASINIRTKPLFQSVNPGMSGGVGINDDMIAPGGLSPTVITGTAVVLTSGSEQTISSDITVTGDVSIDSLKIEADKVNLIDSLPATALSVLDMRSASFMYESPDPASVTTLDDGVIGQRITITFSNNGVGALTLTSSLISTATADSIVLEGNDDIVLANGDVQVIEFLLVDATEILDAGAANVWIQQSKAVIV
mgnify:CR=1 FL=1